MAFVAARWPQKRIELRAPIVIFRNLPAGILAGPASSTRGASFYIWIWSSTVFEAPLKAAGWASYIRE